MKFYNAFRILFVVGAIVLFIWVLVKDGGEEKPSPEFEEAVKEEWRHLKLQPEFYLKSGEGFDIRPAENVVFWWHNQEVAKFHMPTGKLTFGPGMPEDEAARKTWIVLEQQLGIRLQEYCR